MQAWMWRLTDEHAVLYTDDRATLKALFAYSRFPHQDLSRATTYERKNGRVFAWQFTFPISAWNGVVRFLGRSSITMLDQERGGQATVTNAAPAMVASPPTRSGRGKKGERPAAVKSEVPAAPARPVRAKAGKPVVDLSQPLQPMVTPAARSNRPGKGQVSQPAAQSQPEPVSRRKKADTVPVVEIVTATAAPAASATPQPARKKRPVDTPESAAVPVSAAVPAEIPVAVTRGRTARKVAAVPVVDAAPPVTKPGRSNAAGVPSAVMDAASPRPSPTSAAPTADLVQSSPKKSRPGRKPRTTELAIADPAPEARPGKVVRETKVPTAPPQVKPLAVEELTTPARTTRKPARATSSLAAAPIKQVVLDLPSIAPVILPDLMEGGKPRRSRATNRDAGPDRGKEKEAVAATAPEAMAIGKKSRASVSEAQGPEKPPKRAAASGSATRVAPVPEPVGRGKRPKTG